MKEVELRELISFLEEALWPLENSILDSFPLSEDKVSHLPTKVNLVTYAGGQLSLFLRNSILFHSVLVISMSPSSLALSSQHIIMLRLSN